MKFPTIVSLLCEASSYHQRPGGRLDPESEQWKTFPKAVGDALREGDEVIDKMVRVLYNKYRQAAGVISFPVSEDEFLEAVHRLADSHKYDKIPPRWLHMRTNALYSFWRDAFEEAGLQLPIKSTKLTNLTRLFTIFAGEYLKTTGKWLAGQDNGEPKSYTGTWLEKHAADWQV